MFQLETKTNPTGFPPVSETLPQAIDRIVASLKPERIILFGSCAYDNPTLDSDGDLLIIMETNGKRKEKHRAASMLLHPRQFPVDILIQTPKEVEDALKGGKNNSFFIREIIKKGKVLYERRKRT